MVSPRVYLKTRVHSRICVFSVLDTKFLRTCGGTCPEVQRRKATLKYMRYDIEVVDEAFCAYHVGGVCGTGERVRTWGASLTRAGGRILHVSYQRQSSVRELILSRIYHDALCNNQCHGQPLLAINTNTYLRWPSKKRKASFHLISLASPSRQIKGSRHEGGLWDKHSSSRGKLTRGSDIVSKPDFDI